AVSSVNELDEESVLSSQVNGRYEISIDLSPPPSPSGFEITSIGNGAVSLRWDMVAVDDFLGYNVYWRGGAPADTVSANKMFTGDATVTIANLDYELLYYFAVSAVDQSGNESAFSLQLNGKALNTTSPSPPTGVNSAAENVNVPLVNIFWEQNSEPDLSYYKIYRALSPAGLEDLEAAFVDSVFTEFYTDYNIEVGTMYFYQITALDKDDWESAPSPIVSDKALPPVELISPINYQYTNENPTFRWKTVEGAAKYELTLKASRIGSEIWYKEVNSDTTEITYSGSSTLISGNTYYWQVGAITKTGINSVSSVGMFVVSTK
ncbi:fibronectin type III domain-containing protein, partial [Candidatus Latescibacterota bacterium]